MVLNSQLNACHELQCDNTATWRPFQCWNKSIRYIGVRPFLTLCIIISISNVAFYCQFSLPHHNKNHSTNKAKNQRGNRRWIFKRSCEDSGLCNVLCGRYSKKINVLLKFIRLNCMEMPCLYLSERHEYGGWKLTEACVIKFTIKSL